MNNKLSIGEGITGYSGEVGVTLINNGIRYKTIKTHNSGTEEFFKYVLKCICGQPEYEYRPAYLYLYNYNSQTEEETQVVNFGILYEGDVNITSSNTLNNPSASLTYRFMVPSTIIRGQQINKIKLKSLSKKNGDYLTYAELVLPETIQIDTDINLEIEWTLILSNKEKKSDE